MKEKKGISLIVLIVTIIVMIIIAGAVIISLTETNIIDQAELAVEKHNISELKSAASMAYADYLANKHSDEEKIQLNVQEYIREQLIKQGVATWEDFSKWYITPTGGIEEIDQEALTLIVEVDEEFNYDIEISGNTAIVDWGDGSEKEEIFGIYTHKYKPGTYELKIIMKEADYIYLNTLSKNITAIKSFGNTEMLGFMGHEGMDKLEYVSMPNEKSFVRLVELYIHDSNIRTLPERMFKNCSEDFCIAEFNNSYNLRYIPNNLFEGLDTSKIDISFKGCTTVENASDFPAEWFE